MRHKTEVADTQQQVVPRAAYGFELDRRRFFQWLGSGVLVFAGAKASWSQSRSAEEGSEEPPPDDIASWLHVGESGEVTVYTGKAEMGQNIRTSLAQQVAEELKVPFSSVRLVMADTQLTPYDMGTFGSRTTPYMGPQLRKAAASARETLTLESKPGRPGGR